MAHIAYVRVSTAEQNEARQIEALKKHDIDKWYTEKVSGKNMNRPQLKAMLDYVREGDTVYIHDFSRLARSTKDLLAIDFTKCEVHHWRGKENNAACNLSICLTKKQHERYDRIRRGIIEYRAQHPVCCFLADLAA